MSNVFLSYIFLHYTSVFTHLLIYDVSLYPGIFRGADKGPGASEYVSARGILSLNIIASARPGGVAGVFTLWPIATINGSIKFQVDEEGGRVCVCVCV